MMYVHSVLPTVDGSKHFYLTLRQPFLTGHRQYISQILLSPKQTSIGEMSNFTQWYSGDVDLPLSLLFSLFL